MTASEPERCGWAGGDPLYLAYHDREWGVPVHDDVRLFEMLTLEGAQAGLSWLTILRKREGYRRAFDGFDPVRVAKFNDKRVEALLADAGIVRNRAKIASTIGNAAATLAVQGDEGGLDAFLWRFVGGVPKQNAWLDLGEVPASTEESNAMSTALKQRGFRFVGPTVCYAFMQACGFVNDHVTSCYRHAELS